MRWKKLGMVFNADGRAPWLLTHAANPVAEAIEGGAVRVYFSSRGEKNRAHIAFVDIELTPAHARVLRVAEEPVLAPGPTGTFDDSGVSMGCVVHDGPRSYLFYMGWNLGVTVPWRNSIGLAIREAAGQPFVKYSPAPVMDRSAADPFTLSYPSVIRDNGVWRMWYGSNLRWGSSESDMDHVIKHATSTDLVHWQRDGRVVLGLEGDGEIAVCRPWVVPREGGYGMWFCRRRTHYRMDYATSPDGLRWTRSSGQSSGQVVEPSAEGWDSEMVSYPSIFEHGGHAYLFYNGNHYGRTGFGVAVAA